MVSSYLIKLAANRPSGPLVTAKIDELLAKLLVGILGHIVIHAGQVLAEEALLAAMASKCTSPGFVFWSICFCVGRRCHQQSRGTGEPACDSMTHGGRERRGRSAAQRVEDQGGSSRCVGGIRNEVDKDCNAAMAANKKKEMASSPAMSMSMLVLMMGSIISEGSGIDEMGGRERLRQRRSGVQ